MNKIDDIIKLLSHLDNKKKLNEEELYTYILCDLYVKHSMTIQSNSIEELNDITPSLLLYETAKEEYKINNEVDLILPLQKLLKEIIEFIEVLYKNVDTSEERVLLDNAIKHMTF